MGKPVLTTTPIMLQSFAHNSFAALQISRMVELAARLQKAAFLQLPKHIFSRRVQVSDGLNLLKTFDFFS